MSARAVLVVAHLPKASPRIPGLARYLPACGWRPVVVTPCSAAGGEEPTVRTIETPHRPVLGVLKSALGADPHDGLRVQLTNRLPLDAKGSLLDRLLGVAAEVVNYPDADKHWRPVALAVIEDLLRREDIKAVISSSPPVTAHVIAGELKARYGLPWVADLRDLWSQNHNYGYGSIRRHFDLRLERKTLATADALVTVSGPWAERLRGLHTSKVVHAITNGFDPAYVNGGEVELPARFTITYTGSIHRPMQDPWSFFIALRALIDDGTIDPDRLDVRFHTAPAAWLDKQIREAGLERVVRQPGIVPYRTALRLQQASHALLLLNWEDLREKGCYPLKIFEYLAAKRPILAIGGSATDVVTQLLSETQAGVSCPDIDAVKTCVAEMYRKYIASRTVRYYGIEQHILKYGYDAMAERFATILTAITAKTVTRCVSAS